MKKSYVIAFPSKADADLWAKFESAAAFKEAFDGMNDVYYQMFAIEADCPISKAFDTPFQRKPIYSFCFVSWADYCLLAEIDEYEQMTDIVVAVMGKGVVGSNADWCGATIWNLFSGNGCDGLYLVRWSDNDEFTLTYRYYDELDPECDNNENTILKTATNVAETIALLVHIKGIDFPELQQFLNKHTNQ